jgi:hypothetical protein
VLRSRKLSRTASDINHQRVFVGDINSTFYSSSNEAALFFSVDKLYFYTSFVGDFENHFFAILSFTQSAGGDRAKVFDPATFDRLSKFKKSFDKITNCFASNFAFTKNIVTQSNGFTHFFDNSCFARRVDLGNQHSNGVGAHIDRGDSVEHRLGGFTARTIAGFVIVIVSSAILR